MGELLAKYGIVFFWGMTKFLFGPTTAYALQLHWLESSLLTSAGMMTSIVIVSFVGNQIKSWYLKRRKQKNKTIRIFTRRNRLIVRIWQRSGVYGISFLTPVLFSPIVGAILAVSLERNIRKIWFSMLLASLFWAFVISLGITYFGDSLRQYL